MARIARQNFSDWFAEYFLPEMSVYVYDEESNLYFRVTFTFDNAISHVFLYVSLSGDVKLNSVPPQTTPAHAADEPLCD
jgi:hypothetical protein